MARIKCGNCKQLHSTVTEVRDCYAQAAEDDAQAKAEYEAEKRAERYWEEGPDSFQAVRFAEGQEELFRVDPDAQAAAVLDQMAGEPGKDMASDNQVAYALDLLDSHEWPDVITEDDLRNMERRQVTKLINGLNRAPLKKDGPEVPAGRYAIPGTGDEVRFYQVDIGKGKWAGHTFVNELFGAPGSFRKSTVGRVRSREVLKQIAVDPASSSMLFGLKLGICGVCASPLTNEESRLAGIGPKCRSKRGW